jgi:hypothetical protein
MIWNTGLPSSGKEEPRAYRILTHIFAVLFIPLGIAFMLIYKIGFSWWLTAILAKKHHEAFSRKVSGRSDARLVMSFVSLPLAISLPHFP